MKDRFDDLLYQSGLTAQGCWDELDDYAKDAIMKFGELTILKCADIALREDHDPSDCILGHFGMTRAGNEWKCPIKLDGCTENCGSYGCGN